MKKSKRHAKPIKFKTGKEPVQFSVDEMLTLFWLKNVRDIHAKTLAQMDAKINEMAARWKRAHEQRNHD